MKYIVTMCFYSPGFALAVMDNDVRNLSGGGGLFIFIVFILAIIFAVNMIKLFANVTWNAGVKRKVNIPNWPLHLKVANALLRYEGGVDLNTWVTKEEASLVQAEVNRLHQLEREDLAAYYKRLDELETAKKASKQMTVDTN